ncbi:MAG: hypothetical protein SFX18_02080 [Pirellulales bacterium]|nr:hypothetical protein [Pirellulales bacterium]
MRFVQEELDMWKNCWHVWLLLAGLGLPESAAQGKQFYAGPAVRNDPLPELSATNSGESLSRHPRETNAARGMPSGESPHFSPGGPVNTDPPAPPSLLPRPGQKTPPQSGPSALFRQPRPHLNPATVPQTLQKSAPGAVNSNPVPQFPAKITPTGTAPTTTAPPAASWSTPAPPVQELAPPEAPPANRPGNPLAYTPPRAIAVAEDQPPMDPSAPPSWAQDQTETALSPHGNPESSAAPFDLPPDEHPPAPLLDSGANASTPGFPDQTPRQVETPRGNAVDSQVRPVTNLAALSRARTANSTARPAADAAAMAALRQRDLKTLKSVSPEASEMDGIQPGKSSWQTALSKFGQPRETRIQEGQGTARFDFPPFEYLEVTIHHEQVAAIQVETGTPLDPDAALKQLGLDELRSVIITDDAGLPLGVSFPDRGVVLSLDDAGTAVKTILLEPLSADMFVWRAEEDLPTQPLRATADLLQALRLNGKCASAWAYLAKIYKDLGHHTAARAAAQSARKSEPNEPRWMVTQAEVWLSTGSEAQALQTLKNVLQMPDLSPDIQAAAEYHLGEAYTLGEARDYTLALEHHLRAIKLAEAHITAANPKLRRTMKQILLNANLATANDIAWGNFQNKEFAVTKWLERSTAVANNLIKEEGWDAYPRLAVARQALAACAGTQGTVDPTPWTKSALATSKQLLADTNDPWRKRQIDWELGHALYDALQADQARGVQSHALANSALVVKYLEEGSQTREQSDHDDFVLGRLYFRIGAIFALDKADHRTAAYWYDKSLPLLERAAINAQPADWGRQGETLVSIGLSYWEIGRQPEAVRLTEQGIDWMVKAVHAHALPESALGVPYGNLASMHQTMGNADKARDYEELTKSVRGESMRR